MSKTAFFFSMDKVVFNSAVEIKTKKNFFFFMWNIKHRSKLLYFSTTGVVIALYCRRRTLAESRFYLFVLVQLVFKEKKKTDKNSLHTFKRVLRLLFELLLIYIYFFRLLSGRLRRVSNEILPRNSFPENPSARCNCIRPSFHFHPVTERILRGEQSSKVSGRRRRARSDRITAADERQRE